MFYGTNDGRLDVLAAKNVDGILTISKTNVLGQVLQTFNVKFKFGTMVHGANKLRHFVLSIVQHDELKYRTDGKDKLTTLESALLTRLRCKAAKDDLNELERSLFSFFNSSLRWLGTSVSFPVLPLLVNSRSACLMFIYLIKPSTFMSPEC